MRLAFLIALGAAMILVVTGASWRHPAVGLQENRLVARNMHVDRETEKKEEENEGFEVNRKSNFDAGENVLLNSLQKKTLVKKIFKRAQQERQNSNVDKALEELDTRDYPAGNSCNT